MPQHQLTPTQKSKIKEQEKRRRRERQRREDEYRSRIEHLRQQIAEARRRRQRMLLLFLLAVLAIQESLLTAFTRLVAFRPDPTPERRDWTPDPSHDYAPAPGSIDHCDGYSFEQWNRLLNERGIRISRKAQLKAAWEADPERKRFPSRYQEWGYKPYLGQIMHELTASYWQQDALIALKLLSPTNTHKYLDEACAIDPGDLRQCLAGSDRDIIQALQTRAVLWEERKRHEAEEAKRDKELSRKAAETKGIPSAYEGISEECLDRNSKDFSH